MRDAISWVARECGAGSQATHMENVRRLHRLEIGMFERHIPLSLNRFAGGWDHRLCPLELHGRIPRVPPEFYGEGMGFGLKNLGTTFIRTVAKLFGEFLGKLIESYVNDMLVKSEEANHAEDMPAWFRIMRKCNLRLNPKKCTFSVRGGKFLGYMSPREG